MASYEDILNKYRVKPSSTKEEKPDTPVQEPASYDDILAKYRTAPAATDAPAAQEDDLTARAETALDKSRQLDYTYGDALDTSMLRNDLLNVTQTLTALHRIRQGDTAVAEEFKYSGGGSRREGIPGAGYEMIKDPESLESSIQSLSAQRADIAAQLEALPKNTAMETGVKQFDQGDYLAGLGNMIRGFPQQVVEGIIPMAQSAVVAPVGGPLFAGWVGGQAEYGTDVDELVKNGMPLEKALVAGQEVTNQRAMVESLIPGLNRMAPGLGKGLLDTGLQALGGAAGEAAAAVQKGDDISSGALAAEALGSSVSGLAENVGSTVWTKKPDADKKPTKEPEGRSTLREIVDETPTNSPEAAIAVDIARKAAEIAEGGAPLTLDNETVSVPQPSQTLTAMPKPRVAVGQPRAEPGTGEFEFSSTSAAPSVPTVEPTPPVTKTEVKTTEKTFGNVDLGRRFELKEDGSLGEEITQLWENPAGLVVERKGLGGPVTGARSAKVPTPQLGDPTRYSPDWEAFNANPTAWRRANKEKISGAVAAPDLSSAKKALGLDSVATLDSDDSITNNAAASALATIGPTDSLRTQPGNRTAMAREMAGKMQVMLGELRAKLGIKGLDLKVVTNSGLGDLPEGMRDSLAHLSTPTKGGGTRFGSFITTGPNQAVIYINDDALMDADGNVTARGLETITHEFGHGVEAGVFWQLPEAERDAVINAWLKDRGLSKTLPAHEALTLLLPTNARASGKSSDTLDQVAERQGQPEYPEYVRSFEEWWANNTAKHLTTTQSSHAGPVRRAFTKASDAIKEVYNAVIADPFNTRRAELSGPNKQVAEFYRRMNARAMRGETVTADLRTRQKVQAVTDARGKDAAMVTSPDGSDGYVVRQDDSSAPAVQQRDPRSQIGTGGALGTRMSPENTVSRNVGDKTGLSKLFTKAKTFAQTMISGTNGVDLKTHDTLAEVYQKNTAQIMEAENYVKILNESVQQELGTTSPSAARRQMYPAIQKYLDGDTKALDGFPKTKEAAENIRGAIDGLTKKLAKAGAFAESDLPKVAANLGKYVFRSYRIDDVKPDKWWDTLVTEYNSAKGADEKADTRIGKAKSFVYSKYGINKDPAKMTDAEVDHVFDFWFPRDTGADVKGKRAKLEELRSSWGDGNIDSVMTEAVKDLVIGGQKATRAFPRTSQAARQDLTITKEREDVPKVIRDLWGQYDDPAVNTIKTLTKMGDLLNRTSALNKLAESGKGSWLFKKGDPRPEGFGTELVGENLGPLNGMYTTEYMANLIGGVMEASSMGSTLFDSFVYGNADESLADAAKRGLRKTNAMAKMVTVVHDITNAMMNLVGFGLQTINAGHWIGAKKLPQSVKLALKDVQSGLSNSSLDTDTVQSLKDMIERGVLRDSVLGKSFQRSLRELLDMSQSDLAARIATQHGLDPERPGLAGRVFEETGQALSEIFQAGDTVAKVLGYTAELDALRSIYGDRYTESQLKDFAAERVKNLYPTYSRAPRFARAIGGSALFGPFAIYAAESMRVVPNAIKIGGIDIVNGMREGNPKLIAHGVNKAIGPFLAYGAFKAAAGMVAAFSGSSGGEEEEKKIEAARVLAPEWFADATIVPMGRSGESEHLFMDLNTLNPYETLHRPIDTLARSIESGDEMAVGKALAELTELFTAESLMLKPMYEAYTNVRLDSVEAGERTRALTNEEGTTGAAERAWHVGKKLVPFAGTVSSIVKSGQTASEASSFAGGIQLIGGQPIRIDVNKALYGSGIEAKDKLLAARSRLTKLMTSDKEVTKEELATALQEADAADMEIVETLRKKVKAARTLEKRSDSDIAELFKASGLGDDMLAAVVSDKDVKRGFGRAYLQSQLQRDLALSASNTKDRTIAKRYTDRMSMLSEVIRTARRSTANGD